MKDSDRYLKIVEWSEDDGCYLGSAIGLIEHCCHGDNEIEVFKQLCVIVDEWIVLLNTRNKELPSPSYPFSSVLLKKSMKSDSNTASLK